MDANNSSNVSAGKGLATGYLCSAPQGTTLPTDATTALDTSFVNLGYCDEDGITRTIETDTEDVKDLNGDTVLSIQTSRTESLKFNLLETKKETLAEAFGQDNVSVDSTSKAITVKSNSNDMPYRAFVANFVLTGGRKARLVLPKAKPSEWEDQEYKSGDAIKYGLTVKAAPDSAGNTAYLYITAASSSANDTKAGK